MTRKELTALVTGCGAPGIRGTLYALRENPDKTPVRTVGIDLTNDAVGRHLVDRFYLVCPPEDSGYCELLRTICERERVDVILPQTTREIVTLSAAKAYFEEGGIAVVVSDFPAISLANSKLRVLESFREQVLPYPAFQIARTVEQLTEAARALGYPRRPVVVKPAESNGMRGVRVVCEQAWNVERFFTEKPSGLEISLDELQRILGTGEAWPDLVVSEFLPGAEYSVDAFVGTAVRIAIPRRRQAIRSGISFDTVVERREDLAHCTLRAAEAIGLKYAFGFQFKLDEAGVPKVLECNPRVQGTMVASVFAGANVIWYGVQEALGQPPTVTPTDIVGCRFQRYWGGVALRNGHVVEI